MLIKSCFTVFAILKVFIYNFRESICYSVKNNEHSFFVNAIKCFLKGIKQFLKSMKIYIKKINNKFLFTLNESIVLLFFPDKIH